MLDRSRVWAGDLNASALDPQPTTVVGLCDATLRAGVRMRAGLFERDQQLVLAQALDEAGVDRIEVGLESAEDRDAAAAIAGGGLRAELWGRRSLGSGEIATSPDVVRGVVLEVTISARRSDSSSETPDRLIGRVSAAIARTAERDLRVAFYGGDATRAEPSVLDRVLVAAVEAGASELVIADTAGVATPEAAAMLVSRVVDRVDVPVHWDGRDDFGLGTAAAIAAVQAGAAWAHATVDGLDERAGSVDLIELALALEALYGIPTRFDLQRAVALSRLVHELLGTSIAPWKPVTGGSVFAAAGEPDVRPWLPYDPTLVGADAPAVPG